MYHITNYKWHVIVGYFNTDRSLWVVGKMGGGEGGSI
jgi:hypothetical protein